MDFMYLRFKLGRPIIREVERSLLYLSKPNRSMLQKKCFRSYSDIPKNFNYSDRFSQENLSSFDDVISLRRDQAKRSFLIEASSKNNFSNICELCEQIGKIKTVLNYTLTNGKEVFLVECDTLEMLQEVLKRCRFVNASESLPVRSRLLVLSTKAKRKELKNDSDKFTGSQPEVKLESNTMGAQMDCLYQNERLNDLGVRVRFLICQQLEDALTGLLPHAVVFPFGSTVNGFGRQNCDLDMALHFRTHDTVKSDSDIYFTPKIMSTSGRAQGQRVLETIADMMHVFIPGTTKIARILRARVPIVGFRHSQTEIECDLSYGNICALHMSELLYLYGELDKRVRPLVFTIRMWAKAHALTNKAPGPWISNFSLTLMVIFFLQNRPIPVLPSLKTLINLAENVVQTPEGIDCTFQRYVGKIPPTENTEDAGDLLLEFFLFYEKMNFYKYVLSLRDGTAVLKPNSDTLHIENPLEPELNVSANVSSAEIGHMQEAMRSAIWNLEYNGSPGKSATWGIHRLFESENPNKSSGSFEKSLKVKFLFGEASSEPERHFPNSSANCKEDRAAQMKADLLERIFLKRAASSAKLTRKTNSSNQLSKRTVSSNVSEKNKINQQRNAVKKGDFWNKQR